MLLTGIDHSLELEGGQSNLVYHRRGEVQVKPHSRRLHTGQGAVCVGARGREREREREMNNVTKKDLRIRTSPQLTIHMLCFHCTSLASTHISVRLAATLISCLHPPIPPSPHPLSPLACLRSLWPYASQFKAEHV